MSHVVGDELRFIYSRVLSDSGEVLLEESVPIAVENFLGGSQAVLFDGGWLMLIHEWELAGTRRNYFHRFIWLDSRNRLARFSRRFFSRSLGTNLSRDWHGTCPGTAWSRALGLMSIHRPWP